jgi:NAD(P)-dependent dehydrogenase (short-subunit alcohol dehydrogenase family)
MGGMTILITGGASGIGAETARVAAARGHRVAINYRSRPERAQALVDELRAAGGTAATFQADVADEAGIVGLFEAVERAFGPVGGLVNSAGIGGGAHRVEAMAAATLEELFRVNVVGLILCCREAARRMSTARGGAGGSIVNVSSMAATIGGRTGKSHYAASKAAVDAFTVGFAKEVAAEGIRVNAVRPGVVATDMTAAGLRDPETRAEIEATIPMGRVGTPAEIANAILWLLSGEASFISGARLDASGGGFVIGRRAV